MVKHVVELVGGAMALGGAAYAYKRNKGMPAKPVAPSNPAPALPKLPPPGVVTPPAAAASPTILQTLSGSATNIVSDLGGGVTDTFTPEGLDVMSGGDIGQGETDSNTTGTSTGDTGDTSTDDTSAAEDALLSSV